MYAENRSFGYNEDSRNVFTWRRKNVQLTQGLWEFWPTDDDNIFKIKNTFYKEYLYASVREYFSHNSKLDRRHVFTWRYNFSDSDPYSWFIRHECGNLFSIKNVRSQDYLYAAADFFALDNDRRRVFSWVPGTREKDAVWEILC